MKSIQTKILVLILSCVLAASALNGLCGIFVTSKLVNDTSNENIGLLTRENAQKIDTILDKTENSVDTLALFISESLESAERLWTDDDYRLDFLEKIEKVSLNHAYSTKGSRSVFVRFNPEYSPAGSGLYWTRPEEDDLFSEQIPTDIQAFRDTDPDYVDWWYEPSEAGAATWLRPHNRDAIDVWTVTYVVPLYKNGILFGVVGIGISFRMIEEIAWDIHVYDTGHALIINKDGTFMYHPRYAFGKSLRTDPVFSSLADRIAQKNDSERLIHYTHEGNDKLLSYHTLKNGMTFIITVPERKINAARNQLIRSEIIFTLIILSVASAIALLFSRRLIRQIKEVDAAAKQMLSGNLNAPPRRTTNDEAGELADSIREMQEQINNRILTLNAASYQDELTGVKNKNAYALMESRLNRAIEDGTAEFAIAIFDANYLKETNDRHGHYMGDELLKSICFYICDTFKHSPVYRIGGDEFLVVLQGQDLQAHKELLEKYHAGIPALFVNEYPEIPVSCACGLAVFNPETDTCCADVFKNADKLMYLNKKSQKEVFKASLEFPKR